MAANHCRNAGCPGRYEDRRVAVIEYHDGRPVVVDDVPAQVCDECGDELLDWQTVRRMEALHRNPPEPIATVPLYRFTDAPALEEVAAARGTP